MQALFATAKCEEPKPKAGSEAKDAVSSIHREVSPRHIQLCCGIITAWYVLDTEHASPNITHYLVQFLFQESAGSEDEPSKLVSAPVENAWERRDLVIECLVFL